MEVHLETALLVVLEQVKQCLKTVCLTSVRITMINHNGRELFARALAVTRNTAQPGWGSLSNGVLKNSVVCILTFKISRTAEYVLSVYYIRIPLRFSSLLAFLYTL